MIVIKKKKRFLISLSFLIFFQTIDSIKVKGETELASYGITLLLFGCIPWVRQEIQLSNKRFSVTQKFFFGSSYDTWHVTWEVNINIENTDLLIFKKQRMFLLFTLEIRI